MKIVLLNHVDLLVEVLNIPDCNYPEDIEVFLDDKGYNLEDISWMELRCEITDYVPVIFHEYTTEEQVTEDVQLSKEYELKNRDIYEQVDYIKRREKEELIKAVRTHGKKGDGGFEVHFDENEPIIAGYLYDEPCDIVIKTVKVDEQGHLTILGEDKKDRGCAFEIDSDDFFAGQLDYVINEVGA